MGDGLQDSLHRFARLGPPRASFGAQQRRNGGFRRLALLRDLVSTHSAHQQSHLRPHRQIPLSKTRRGFLRRTENSLDSRRNYIGGPIDRFRGDQCTCDPGSIETRTWRSKRNQEKQNRCQFLQLEMKKETKISQLAACYVDICLIRNKRNADTFYVRVTSSDKMALND